MEAHVLHIGVDDCHRVAVLRSVGYRVDECATLPQMARALKGANPTDAVFLTESNNISQEKAISLAREHSPTPLILFQSSNQETTYKQFDLVIEPLTSPGRWLREVRGLVERSRLLRTQSPVIREQWRHMRSPRILELDPLSERTQRLEANLLRLWNPQQGGR